MSAKRYAWQSELEQRAWFEIDPRLHKHRFLDTSDTCFALFTNNGQDLLQRALVSFKGWRSLAEKQAAIASFGDALAHLIDTLVIPGHLILVPMPPHIPREHYGYDERTESACLAAADAFDGVYCLNLLETVVPGQATHEQARYRTIEGVEQKTAVEIGLSIESDDVILVVDDLISSGAHFKAAKRYLEAIYDASVLGAFMARTPSHAEACMFPPARSELVKRSDLLQGPPSEIAANTANNNQSTGLRAILRHAAYALGNIFHRFLG